MDKQEYREIVSDIRRAYDQKEYDKVLMYAEELDMRRVSDSHVLEMISDSYAVRGDLATARELLLRAYEKTPMGRKIAYKLSELSIQLKDLDGAVDYYEDFCKMAPHDNDRFLLKYKIGKAGNVDNKDLVKVLAAYCSREVDEKWMAELAGIYDELGDTEKCNEICDDIILWFADGVYVKKALELKNKNGELTASQQSKLEQLRTEQEAAKAQSQEADISYEIIDENARDFRQGNMEPDSLMDDDLDSILEEYITIEDATAPPEPVSAEDMADAMPDIEEYVIDAELEEPETEVIPVQLIREAAEREGTKDAEIEEAKEKAKKAAAIDAYTRETETKKPAAEEKQMEASSEIQNGQLLEELELKTAPVHEEVQESIAQKMDQPASEDVPDILGTPVIPEPAPEPVPEAETPVVQEVPAEAEIPAVAEVPMTAEALEVSQEAAPEEQVVENAEPAVAPVNSNGKPFSNIVAMQSARTAPPKDEASFWKIPDELTLENEAGDEEFPEPVYGSHRWFEEKPAPDPTFEEPIFGSHRFVPQPVIEEEEIAEDVVIEQVEPEPIVVEQAEEDHMIPEPFSTIRTTSSGAELLGIYAAAKSADTAENLSEKAAFVKKPALGGKKLLPPEMFADPTTEPEYYEGPVYFEESEAAAFEKSLDDFGSMQHDPQMLTEFEESVAEFQNEHQQEEVSEPFFDDLYMQKSEKQMPAEPEPAEVTPIPVEVKPEPAEVTPIPVEVKPEPAEVTPIPVEVKPEPAEVTPITEPAGTKAAQLFENTGELFEGLEEIIEEPDEFFAEPEPQEQFVPEKPAPDGFEKAMQAFEEAKRETNLEPTGFVKAINEYDRGKLYEEIDEPETEFIPAAEVRALIDSAIQEEDSIDEAGSQLMDELFAEEKSDVVFLHDPVEETEESAAEAFEKTLDDFGDRQHAPDETTEFEESAADFMKEHQQEEIPEPFLGDLYLQKDENQPQEEKEAEDIESETSGETVDEGMTEEVSEEPESKEEPEKEEPEEEEPEEEEEEEEEEPELEGPMPFMFSVMPHESIEEVVPDIVKERAAKKEELKAEQEAAAALEMEHSKEDVPSPFLDDLYVSGSTEPATGEAVQLSEESAQDVNEALFDAFANSELFDDDFEKTLDEFGSIQKEAGEPSEFDRAVADFELAHQQEDVPSPFFDELYKEHVSQPGFSDNIADTGLIEDVFEDPEPEAEPSVFIPLHELSEDKGKMIRPISEKSIAAAEAAEAEEALAEESVSEEQAAEEVGEEAVLDEAPDSGEIYDKETLEVEDAGEDAADGFGEAVQDFELSRVNGDESEWAENYETEEMLVDEAPIIEITKPIPKVEEEIPEEVEEEVQEEIKEEIPEEVQEEIKEEVPEEIKEEIPVPAVPEEQELSDFERAMRAFENNNNAVPEEEFSPNELDAAMNEFMEEDIEPWAEPEFGMPDFNESEFAQPEYLGSDYSAKEPAEEKAAEEVSGFEKALREFEKENLEALVNPTPEEPEVQAEPETEKLLKPMPTPVPVPVKIEAAVPEKEKYSIPDDLKEELSEFLLIDGMEERICNTIENIIDRKRSGDPTGGHLIVTGDAKSGKTYLTISIIKAVGKEIGSSTGRVAKVQAESLNGKDMKKVFGKIAGSDLIIENAGYLNDDTIEKLMEAMRNTNSGTMVVLEGNELGIENILAKHPQLETLFHTRLNLNELTLAQWADLACAYARRRGYVVGDMALLALHAKIDEMNLPTTRLVTEDVRGIIDKAIEKSRKRSAGRLFGGKKNRDSRQELDETDFM